MTTTTPPPLNGPNPSPLPPPPTSASSSLRKVLLKIAVIVLGLMLAAALTLYRIYGVDTHHASRSSIWWPEHGRSLIPPTATDITLRRDLLDHYAIYTVSEADLGEFLMRRFARPGQAVRSASERSPARPETVGTIVGPLGWVVTKDTVVYTAAESNGTAHTYHHDTRTGRTYQVSAYW